MCLWTWKNFSPDSIIANFEVLKLLNLCRDWHEVCFKWWSKGVFMIIRRWIFEFHFYSPWGNKNELTWSRSFSRGVASGVCTCYFLAQAFRAGLRKLGTKNKNSGSLPKQKDKLLMPKLPQIQILNSSAKAHEMKKNFVAMFKFAS